MTLSFFLFRNKYFFNLHLLTLLLLFLCDLFCNTKTVRSFKGHRSKAQSASPHELLTLSPYGLRASLLSSPIFCKSPPISNLLAIMLSPSKISCTSFFLQSKSRKPLCDMDRVYNYEMQRKPPTEPTNQEFQCIRRFIFWITLRHYHHHHHYFLFPDQSRITKKYHFLFFACLPVQVSDFFGPTPGRTNSSILRNFLWLENPVE